MSGEVHLAVFREVGLDALCELVEVRLRPNIEGTRSHQSRKHTEVARKFMLHKFSRPCARKLYIDVMCNEAANDHSKHLNVKNVVPGFPRCAVCIGEEPPRASSGYHVRCLSCNYRRKADKRVKIPAPLFTVSGGLKPFGSC